MAESVEQKPQSEASPAFTLAPWRHSRYGFALACFLSLLVGWLALRIVLFAQFAPPTDVLTTLKAFAAGLTRDSLMAAAETIPLLCWFLLISNRRFGAKWHRIFLLFALGFAAFVQIFLLFVEYFFFEEFRSRFNTVAVDYLIYPQEVFVNIWESYHVGIILVICFVLSVASLVIASRFFHGMWRQPFSFKLRALHLFGAVA